MSDNVLQTLQTLVQDVVAPDLRELKVRVESVEKRMETRFTAVDARFDSLEKQIESNQRANERQLEALSKMLLAAIGELKAQNKLATMSAVADLRERVAVLEAQRN